LDIGGFGFWKTFQWMIGTSKYAINGGACNRKYAENRLKMYPVKTSEIS
jgi:hypothetical protein